MSRNLDIEARLERSLRGQVKAPRLPRRFDAAVWARIDAESAKAPALVLAMPTWHFVINGIGMGVALLMLVIFGGQWLLSIEPNLPLPPVSMSAATIEQIMETCAPAVTTVALVFGLMFTPLGRALRRELM